MKKLRYGMNSPSPRKMKHNRKVTFIALPSTDSIASKTTSISPNFKRHMESRASIRKMLMESRKQKRNGSMDAYAGPVGTAARLDFF